MAKRMLLSGYFVIRHNKSGFKTVCKPTRFYAESYVQKLADAILSRALPDREFAPFLHLDVETPA